MKTKPTGKMPVEPKFDGRRPKGKDVIFGPAAITALLMMGVAVMLVRFVYTANAGEQNSKPDQTTQNETEIAPIYLTDGEICGIWSAVDYIKTENLEDFDPKKPEYTELGVKLPYYLAEFFSDGTLTVKASNSSGEAVYNWINGDTLDILSGISELITVREIRQIGGKDYMFVDFSAAQLIPEAPQGYYVFSRRKTKYVYGGDDVQNKDLRNYNFSEAWDLHTVSFNEDTIFPPALQKTALSTMKRGQNPGLGVRALHERGITGKGVNVAIIDEPLDMGHPEYAGKIIEYKDFSGEADFSSQGSGVAGLLAGESMGTAPGVNIYYAAVPAWDMYDARYYALALDWIIELNSGLPEDEKIKAVCISPNPENPLPWINVEEYLISFMRAEKEGILVLDCTDEHGVALGACSYDYENPEDVSLCKPKGAYRIAIAPYHYDGEAKEIFTGEEPNENMLRVPISYKTLPETGEDSSYKYRYDTKGQLSWALPYATGVLAMGWQLSPELGGDKMIEILFDTAYIDKSGNKYINPKAFIEQLENN